MNVEKLGKGPSESKAAIFVARDVVLFFKKEKKGKICS